MAGVVCLIAAVMGCRSSRRPPRRTIERRDRPAGEIGKGGFLGSRRRTGYAGADLMECLLFDEWQAAIRPTPRLLLAHAAIGIGHVVIAPAARRKELVHIMMQVPSQRDLL